MRKNMRMPHPNSSIPATKQIPVKKGAPVYSITQGEMKIVMGGIRCKRKSVMKQQDMSVMQLFRIQRSIKCK